jgi:hypothetical protein
MVMIAPGYNDKPCSFGGKLMLKYPNASPHSTSPAPAFYGCTEFRNGCNVLIEQGSSFVKWIDPNRGSLRPSGRPISISSNQSLELPDDDQLNRGGMEFEQDGWNSKGGKQAKPKDPAEGATYKIYYVCNRKTISGCPLRATKTLTFQDGAWICTAITEPALEEHVGHEPDLESKAPKPTVAEKKELETLVSERKRPVDIVKFFADRDIAKGGHTRIRSIQGRSEESQASVSI